MLTLSIREKNGEERQLSFDKEEVTIGRASGSDIVLPRNNISKRHARLVDKHDKVVIVDLRSTNGTYVNGRRITAPELLTGEDKVYIGDFVIRLGQGLDLSRSTAPYAASVHRDAPQQPADPRLDHSATLAMEAVPAGMGGMADEDALSRAIAAVEEAEQVPGPPPFAPIDDDDDEEESTQAINVADIAAMQAQMRAAAGIAAPPVPPAARAAQAPDAHRAAPEPRADEPPPPPARVRAAMPDRKQTVASARTAEPVEVGEDQAAWDEWNATVAIILEALDRGPAPETWDDAVEQAVGVVDDAIASGQMADDVERDALIQDAVAECVGLGPLGDLLGDEEVDRVVVDGPRMIRVWRGGVAERYGRVFMDERSLDRAIDRLILEAGFDPATAPAAVDGVLAAGSSLHVVRAPLATSGASVVIRRPPQGPRAAESIADKAALEVMRKAIRSGQHVLVTGRPGSGRTAALSALLGLADTDERVVVIANGHQVVSAHTDVVRLARDADEIEGSPYDEALRLGADRIVIDDVDATNVLEYVSLALTGGVPILASVRAADPGRALEQLALALELASQAPLGRRARALVGQAVHLVVALDPTSRGVPRVNRVVEVRIDDDGAAPRAVPKK